MRRILLVGSSILRRFSYQEPGFIVDNLGKDGLLTQDLLSDHYLHTIYQQSHPYHTMIFYCGNNDLKRGSTPDQILINVEMFISHFCSLYPTTIILVLSLLYSLKNILLQLIPQVQQINLCLQQELQNIKTIHFVDLQPLSDLQYYCTDMVHLNEKGYELLQEILHQRESKTSKRNKQRRRRFRGSLSSISEDGSTKEISEDGSTKEISKNESTKVIPDDESTKEIPEDESTKEISEDGSTKEISDDESTKEISDDESVKEIIGHTHDLENLHGP